MDIREHDAKCTALWRKLDALKAQGADAIRGGEYDAVLRELQTATKARLGACGLIAPSLEGQ